NFHVSQRCQLQILQRQNFRIALRDNARELCRRLEQQYAGKNRFAGKMAAQKWFVVADREFAFAALTGIQLCEPFNEPEFRAMRQKLQSGDKVVHSFWQGCVVVQSYRCMGLVTLKSDGG